MEPEGPAAAAPPLARLRLGGGGRRLHLAWGAGHELRCAAVGPGGGFAAAGPPRAWTVRWGVAGPGRRQIVHDTAAAWGALQRRKRAGQPPELLAYSASVKAVLEAALGGEEGPLVAREKEVWELLEAYVVRPRQAEGVVAGLFAHWARKASRPLGLPQDDRVAKALLEQNAEALEAVGSVPAYWEALQHLLAVGSFALATDALKLMLVTYRQSPERALLEPLLAALESLQVLLQGFPVLAGLDDEDAGWATCVCYSVDEFGHQRGKWLHGCRLLQGDEEVWHSCRRISAEAAEGLRGCVAILMGDEARLFAATSNWLDFLAGLLLHVHPTVTTRVEMRQLGEYCIVKKDQPLRDLDRLILNVIDVDLEEAMARCSKLFSPWFVAHVADMMEGARPPNHAADMLRRPMDDGLADLGEKYCVDLAEALMPHHSTWPVALDYLQHCAVSGKALIDRLLLHAPLDVGDAAAAAKAVGRAERLGRPHVARALCRAIGARHWRAGELGAAIWWLRRADDQPRLELLAASLTAEVEGALLGGGAAAAAAAGPELARLESLMASLADDPEDAGGEAAAAGSDAEEAAVAAGADALSFLKQLRRLQTSLAAMAASAAGGEARARAERGAKRAVLRLLAPGVCPPRLWVPILFHAIPLLDAAAPVFTAAETEGLLQQLYRVVGVAGPAAGSAQAVQLAAVQLAVMRNLSRATLLLAAEPPGASGIP